MKRLILRYPGVVEEIWWRKEETAELVFVRHGRYLIAGSTNTADALREMLLTREHARRMRAA
jgi:hypothetical protein